MKEKKLEQIKYIKLPKELNKDFESLKLDPNKKLPVQLSPNKKELSEDDITVNNIITGMLTVIAYDEANENFDYYRAFINRVQPDLVKDLNTAAIAKEQKGEYEFAEELFLAVYHLLPQPASNINLATLYSYMAVKAREEKNLENEDKYLLKAKSTLQDGLKRFGEDENILSELSSFEAYMGNLESARDYLERYLNVAKDGERKEELKKIKTQIDFQLKYDTEIKEAYDYIALGMPEKALPVIEKFISDNQKIWNGYFLKGWALRLSKRYKEAEGALLECLKLGERNAEIYNELSICALEEGNRELSTAYLETAADLDPESLSIQSNLAFMYLTDGNYDGARICLEKARYLSGNDELVKELINQYEKITGEKIGDIIHEEIVQSKENDEVEGNEEENPHHHTHGEHCCCNHKEDEAHECCHHHSSDHCSSHHHRNECDCNSESHECKCKNEK